MLNRVSQNRYLMVTQYLGFVRCQTVDAEQKNDRTVLLVWGKTMKRSAVIRWTLNAIIAAGAVLLPKLGLASDLTGLARPVQMTVVSQTLPRVIGELADRSGFAVRMPDRFSARVRHVHLRGSVADALNLLGRRQGFVWYADRTTIYIAKTADQRTVEIEDPAANVRSIDDRLRTLGFDPARWPVRKLPAQDGVVVSGPTRFVKLVQRIASHLPLNRAPAAVLPAVLRGPPAADVR